MANNIFEQMENENSGKAEDVKNTVIKSTPGEVDYNNLSDVAVGDKRKYNRQNLDGKTVKVLSAKVFNASEEDAEIKSINNPNVLYKESSFIITYDTLNEDKMQDREYLSGARQFVQKDKSLSDISFYYDAGDNQVSNLWKLVAAKKGIEPNKLSPKQFMAYLNSGISVVLKYTEINWMKNKYYKNLPVSII
jgi:hypothetical protein